MADGGNVELGRLSSLSIVVSLSDHIISYLVPKAE